jgi:subtilisin family serine protease
VSRLMEIAGAIFELLVRLAAALVLLVVIIVAARAIAWLVKPPRTLLVEAFEVLDGSKVEAKAGEAFARLLSIRLAEIEATLGDNLEQHKLGKLVWIGSVTTPALRLQAEVSSPLDVEFKPFDFDVIGILNAVSKLLRQGPTLTGTVAIKAEKVKVFATYAGRDSEHVIGPWEVSTSSMEEGATILASRISRDFHAAADAPQLGLLTAEQFGSFVKGLKLYQTGVRHYADMRRREAGLGLLRAASAALGEIEAQETRCALVLVYAYSALTLLEDREKADRALENAARLDPANDFVQAAMNARTAAPKASPAEISGAEDVFEAVLRQAALKTTRLAEVQEVARSGAKVLVAVLGTGIDVSDPRLKPRIVGAASVVPTEPDAADLNGFGTSTAGLLAALAPNAEILALKSVDERGAGSDSLIAAAVDEARRRKARIIYLPLGGPGKGPATEKAVQEAAKAGILIIASAGNEGSSEKFYPAAHPEVLAVGALDAGNIAAFSSWGPWVRIYAPGVDITAPWLGGKRQSLSGTSHSAGVVAAVATVVLGQRPALSANELLNHLLESSESIEVEKGGKRLSLRRVDAIAALGGGRVQPKASPKRRRRRAA